MTFNYFTYFLRILGYKSFRMVGWPKMMPSNAVFSVTNLCNSRCKTCHIWERYLNNPELIREEMTTEQWLKTWESIGKTTFCTWTGGEAFMRPDALELLQGLYKYCRPKILVICSNGLLPERYEKIMDEFLSNAKETDVTVNLSLDGIGEQHNEIRGVKGNWGKMHQVIEITKKLQRKYDNLNLGIHTVVSKWNVDKIPEIADYIVKNFNPDSYKMEPSEHRYELGTIEGGILPEREKLAQVISATSTGKNTTKLINLVRQVYIDKYIKGEGLPCYASFNHTQITTNGNVWVCCMQADNEPLGNLHDTGFDFRRVWFSDRADKLRMKVKKRGFNTCKDCYLAVAANTSIPQNLFLTTKYFLKELFRKTT